LVQVEDNGIGTLSDSKSFSFTIISQNDKPTAVTYTTPEEGHNIIIDNDNLDNTNLTFDWSLSTDVDKGDTLIYLFHAEWDTANQVDHPVTTVFHPNILDTKFSVSYVELWDALDFEHRLWFNQPVMKWKVDVTDGIDTTFSTEVRTINIGYYDDLALAEQLYIPTAYALFQNYPNPFNPITRIEYDLPVAGRVQLTIYNLLGQEVTSLIKSWQEPGHYSITWNSQNDHKVMVSSGMYFYYLETQEFKQIKKMILLK